MGGKAFLEIIKGATFPRMVTHTYQHLKARHLEELKQVYRLVDSPREAPEKPDHGDIDFIVCTPIIEADPSKYIKTKTGATHCLKSGSSYNFAIRLEDDKNDAQTYYQVDVNECDLEAEFERILSFQSYGDLSMILGILARANGLALGLHGLKIPHSPEYNLEPYLLSDSFPDILLFFGLDIEPWKNGFPTIHSIFQWIASSHWFDPQSIRESSRRERRRADRKMYHNFLAWVNEQRNLLENPKNDPAELHQIVLSPSSDTTMNAALVFFGKTLEYNSLIDKERRRRGIKDKFNGHLVMEWTGLSGKPVKLLMDEVRKCVDAEMVEMLTREEIRQLVLNTHGKMALISVQDKSS